MAWGTLLIGMTVGSVLGGWNAAWSDISATHVARAFGYDARMLFLTWLLPVPPLLVGLVGGGACGALAPFLLSVPTLLLVAAAAAGAPVVIGFVLAEWARE